MIDLFCYLVKGKQMRHLEIIQQEIDDCDEPYKLREIAGQLDVMFNQYDKLCTIAYGTMHSDIVTALEDAAFDCEELAGIARANATAIEDGPDYECNEWTDKDEQKFQFNNTRGLR